MSKAVFLLGEFVFNTVKVLAAYELIRTNAVTKCGERTERIINGLVAVVIAGLTTWNSVRWDLFSNSMLWINLVIVSISVKVLYRIKLSEGVSVIYLFWVAIHLVDFLVQSVMYYLLIEAGQSALLLMKKDWIRGLYLMAFGICCIWLCDKLKENRIFFQWLRKKKHVQILGIILATVLMVYFQRIYIFLVSDQYVALWIVFLLMVIILGCATIFYTQKLRWDEQEKLHQTRLSVLEENYEQVIRRYKEKATLLHDEKKHMYMIRELLYQGENQRAVKYVEEIVGELEDSGTRVWSGHSVLDLLLNIKLKEAEQSLIDVDMRFDDMKGLRVSDAEICTLISNLLDNAIEANQKIEWPEERWIKFYGERRGNFWIINSSNPAMEKAVMVDGRLMTSKKDKETHGYGSESIRRVLNRYNGDVSYQIEEKRFAVTMFLVGFE